MHSDKNDCEEAACVLRHQHQSQRPNLSAAEAALQSLGTQIEAAKAETERLKGILESKISSIAALSQSVEANKKKKMQGIFLLASCSVNDESMKSIVLLVEYGDLS